ncbi:MAG: hypothetical protein EOO93_20100, partial [Pedobacter sp.]
MFGYATNETENYMPLALDLSHALLKELANLRRENNEITYLRQNQLVKDILIKLQIKFRML